MKRILLLAFSAALLTSLSVPAVADDVKDLYKTKCAACHGADGKGETPAGKKFSAHDFHSADVQKQTDPELIEILRSGKNKMPAYKAKLSDDQIKDLVKYVRELGKGQ